MRGVSDKRREGQCVTWRGSWGNAERGSRGPDYTGFISHGRPSAAPLKTWESSERGDLIHIFRGSL